MIKIEFTIDLKRSVYEQLLEAVEAFAPTRYMYHAGSGSTALYVGPDLQQEAAEVEAAIKEHLSATVEENDATRLTPSTPVETEPTEPKKRGRKAKAEAAPEPAPAVTVPEVNEQDAADEAAEAASDKLTHDDVRSMVGQYTKKMGIVAAQRDIPQILGGAIADIPNEQKALQNSIWAIQKAMAADEAQNTEAEPAGLFGDLPEVAALVPVTEQDVREALMRYAQKYDSDVKAMPNTLVDGVDILKKVFGPTVTALRLMPKDADSLRKALDAINDAIDNNWFNRKVVA